MPPRLFERFESVGGYSICASCGPAFLCGSEYGGLYYSAVLSSAVDENRNANPAMKALLGDLHRDFVEAASGKKIDPDPEKFEAIILWDPILRPGTVLPRQPSGIRGKNRPRCQVCDSEQEGSSDSGSVIFYAVPRYGQLCKRCRGAFALGARVGVEAQFRMKMFSEAKGREPSNEELNEFLVPCDVVWNAFRSLTADH